MLNVAKRLKVRQDYKVSTEFSNSLGDLGKLRVSRMVRMEARPQGLEWGVTDDKVGDPPPRETRYYLIHKSENQAFTRGSNLPNAIVTKPQSED